MISTVRLPEQPTTGTVRYIPLGGDGFVAPFAAYAINSHQVTGDATGTTATLRVLMDPRFCSLTAFSTLQIQQATPGDVACRMDLSGAGYPGQPVSVVMTSIGLVSVVNVSNTYKPVPVVMPGGGEDVALGAVALNVDTDIYTVNALIYLFDISVREKTPMGPLLWARGVG